jgi:hypothetical protein
MRVYVRPSAVKRAWGLKSWTPAVPVATPRLLVAKQLSAPASTLSPGITVRVTGAACRWWHRQATTAGVSEDGGGPARLRVRIGRVEGGEGMSDTSTKLLRISSPNTRVISASGSVARAS